MAVHARGGENGEETGDGFVTVAAVKFFLPAKEKLFDYPVVFPQPHQVPLQYIPVQLITSKADATVNYPLTCTFIPFYFIIL